MTIDRRAPGHDPILISDMVAGEVGREGEKDKGKEGILHRDIEGGKEGGK